LQSALDATVPAASSLLVPTETPNQEQVSAEGSAVSAPENAGESALAPAVLLPTETPTAEPTATAAPTQPPTATPVATATATAPPQIAAEAVAASAVPFTHQIRPGDTLVGIAQQYGVDIDDLMRVNNISPSQVFVLQPGQTIIIPSAGESAPEPTATNTPTTPPTATSEPPTPEPSPTEATVRLDAPILRSPENGTPISCSSQDTLVWLGVPFIKADDKYLLHLGFVSGRTADNQEIVTWVLHQPRPANLTSWDLDAGLCGLAPQAHGRQWRWWVEVVEEQGGDLVPVSRPSATWAFSWN
jgi:LysM repeat protein